MKTRLIQIGNSRGVRLPKPMIEEAGLGDEVELHLQEEGIVLTPVRSPRSGWPEAARLLRERGEDRLLDEPVPAHFDDEEWEW